MGLGRLAFVACAGSLALALLVDDTQRVNHTAVDQVPVAPVDPGTAIAVIAGAFTQIADGALSVISAAASAAGAPAELVRSLASPGPPPGAVRVLVFGDWWTNVGMGPGLLETLFEQRNIPADIKHVRGHKMGACNSAEDPSTLASAIADEFGEEVPDYVWYTAGGYDLMHPGERAFKSDKCPHATREPTEADAVACLKTFTTEAMNACTDQLLTTMWASPLYANVKVVQVGYDLPCTEGLCKRSQPQPKHDPYCKGREVCHRTQLVHWNDFALGKEYHQFGAHADKYTGVNILGAMQSAHPEISGLGAKPGRPNVQKGSPCADTTFCLWPKKGSPGYRAITNAFWDKYWSLQKLDVLVKSRVPGEHTFLK